MRGPVSAMPGVLQVATVRRSAVGDLVGSLLDEQERELARAISDSFELDLGLKCQHEYV